jgi:hypothetical protein
MQYTNTFHTLLTFTLSLAYTLSLSFSFSVIFTLTTRRTNANDSTLAIRIMGVRHHGTTPNQKASAQIPSSRNRLLHQMGGGRTTSNYN